MDFYPEGVNISKRKRFNSFSEIRKAAESGEVFEGRVIRCDKNKNLFVDIGCTQGVIPYNEGALGIIEGTVRDIALISKVGKYVCYRVKGFHREGERLIPVLSRRSVQLDTKLNYIDRLDTGSIIPAVVTRLDGFGAFIDIGSGLNSLIPIDMLSVSRISHPRERLSVGQKIYTVLRKREEGKLTFSLKELLGTWEENAELISEGETVTGIIRSSLPYGVFIELSPNLSGLAEADIPLEEGRIASVYIKSVNKEKMKIKLSVVSVFDYQREPPDLIYFKTGGRLDFWQYSPAVSQKQIFTQFR